MGGELKRKEGEREWCDRYFIIDRGTKKNDIHINGRLYLLYVMEKKRAMGTSNFYNGWEIE